MNYCAWYRLVVEEAPQGATLVEIGSAFGRSTAYLARTAIGQRRDDLTIVAVDPFEWRVALGDPTCDAYRRALVGHVDSDRGGPNGGSFVTMLRGFAIHAPEELERITLLRLPSTAAARVFDRVHFCMIDGDHAEGPVREDLHAWDGKASILSGHDFDLEGVRRAVTTFYGEGKFHVRPAEAPERGDFLPPGSGVGAVWVRNART
jgi:hypothetical protein